MALGRKSRNSPQRDHRSEIFFPKLRNFPPATLLSAEPDNELFPPLRPGRGAESRGRSPRCSKPSCRKGMQCSDFARQAWPELMSKKALTRTLSLGTLAISVLLSQQTTE